MRTRVSDNCVSTIRNLVQGTFFANTEDEKKVMTEKYARYRNEIIQRNFLENCPRGSAI